MKSVQRKFGTFMKRSDNDADVQTVLAEFNAAEEMLDRLIKDMKSWRTAWDDILRYQYDGAETFASLYKPIEPTEDPEMRQRPAETPAKYMQKCLGLQKEYSDEKTDLAQEIELITKRLITPAEDAKQSCKLLHKTLKHRENMKLDYERYLSRAEHVRKKEARSVKEEVALQTHEAHLAQSQIDYQTADEQVRQTFPPVTAAVLSLLPYLLAHQVMLQTTLVGQLYTVLDAYTRAHGLANPAPSNEAIISTWDGEFTAFRKELESGIAVLARGRAVHLGMNLPPEKDKSTVTGLGIRNKVMHRGKDDKPLRPPGAGIRSASSTSALQLQQQPYNQEDDDAAPPKPPRPAGSRTPSMGVIPSSSSPNINLSSKPRISSSPSFFSQNNNGNPPPPYDYKPTALTPTYPLNSPSLSLPSGTSTPPSRYQTPINGAPSPFLLATTPSASNTTPDYFTSARRPSQASSIASSIAAKKKPPPPIPAKRIPSMQGPQMVTALFDFDGQSAGDLAFREGDRIRVVKKTESLDDWWEGELRGKVGSFPANYVQL